MATRAGFKQLIKIYLDRYHEEGYNFDTDEEVDSLNDFFNKYNLNGVVESNDEDEIEFVRFPNSVPMGAVGEFIRDFIINDLPVDDDWVEDFIDNLNWALSQYNIPYRVDWNENQYRYVMRRLS
jgi:hypothetical protein